MVACGITDADVSDHLFVSNLRGNLKDIRSLGAYFDYVYEEPFKMIVIDDFYRMLRRTRTRTTMRQWPASTTASTGPPKCSGKHSFSSTTQARATRATSRSLMSVPVSVSVSVAKRAGPRCVPTHLQERDVVLEPQRTPLPSHRTREGRTAPSFRTNGGPVQPRLEASATLIPMSCANVL